MVAFQSLLTERVSLRPVPPRCACVRCARNGRPADVSASPGQDELRARHALLPARARIPCSASVFADRAFNAALRAACAHRCIFPPTPSSVLHDIRGALRGRHSSVSAPPCRGVLGALYALRARDRPPPPRSQRLRRRRFAPPTRSGSPRAPLVASLTHSFAPSGMDSEREILPDPTGESRSKMTLCTACSRVAAPQALLTTANIGSAAAEDFNFKFYLVAFPAGSVKFVN